MKILVTGAHFTPAQAVIEELQKNPKVEVVYIGRSSTLAGANKPSIESQILPSLGVKYYPITSGGLRRHFDIQTISALFKIPIGFLQSFYILAKERPNVVLSFGGYVAVPVVVTAWLLSIPVILHEQTLVTGLANKISALFADKIAVSFKKDYDFPKNKVILTGNPIRKELINPSKSQTISEFLKDKTLPLVYITGGNQGSHVINQSVEKVLEELTKKAFVIHQTGDSSYKDYEKLVEKKEKIKNRERYLVRKWFDVEDVAHIFKNADLVVSRAGANTLLELAYFGVPTLLIPIPYLYADEQNKNAKFFEELGLARTLPQSELSDKKLLKEILILLSQADSLKKSAKEAKSVVVADASKRLAQETLLLAAR